jgi:hypothetical protein
LGHDDGLSVDDYRLSCRTSNRGRIHNVSGIDSASGQCSGGAFEDGNRLAINNGDSLARASVVHVIGSRSQAVAWVLTRKRDYVAGRSCSSDGVVRSSVIDVDRESVWCGIARGSAK